MSVVYTQLEQKVQSAVDLNIELKEHGAVYLASVADAAVKHATKIDEILKENDSFIDENDLKEGYQLCTQFSLVVNEIVRMCTEDKETLCMLQETQDLEALIQWFEESDRAANASALANRCVTLQESMKLYRSKLDKKYGSLSLRSQISEFMMISGAILGGLALGALVITSFGAVIIVIQSGAAAVGAGFGTAAAVSSTMLGLGAAIAGAGVLLDRDSLKILVQLLTEAAIKLSELSKELSEVGGLLQAYKRMSQRPSFNFDRLNKAISLYDQIIIIAKK
jgi:hypothetical protein